MTGHCLPAVADAVRLQTARGIRTELATFAESADLVDVGAYVKGTNAKLDAALFHRTELLNFLRQDPAERTPLSDGLERVRKLLTSTEPPLVRRLERTT